jgi:hypothetical protein
VVLCRFGGSWAGKTLAFSRPSRIDAWCGCLSVWSCSGWVSFSSSMLSPYISSGILESRLEGVDRRNLKIINLSTHYKPGLALERISSPGERGKTNQPRYKANDTMICFTEVRF